jgi:hypothetical protein
LFNHLPSRLFIVNVAGEIPGFSELKPDIPARTQQAVFAGGANQGGEGDLPFRLYCCGLRQTPFQHTRAQAIRELEALDHSVPIERVLRLARESFQAFFEPLDRFSEGV